MASKPEGSDDTGCVLIIAAICIGGGVGTIWGAPYGWIAVGACLLLAVLVSLAVKR